MTTARLGIIGDGQLARMLVTAAHEVGLKPCILGCKDSPAGIVCADVLSEEEEFFKTVDTVLFESEFIVVEKLRRWEKLVEFFPSLKCIETLQNKFTQKKLLKTLNIPTAKFFEKELLDLSELKIWQDNVSNLFPTRVVLKYSRLGYDGKGVHVGNIYDVVSENFLREALSKKIAVYAEECIAFEQELAITSVVERSGSIKFYPLIVSEQQNGICKFVYGPATSFATSSETEIKAQNISSKLAEATSMLGSFAVEFFYANAELLVNEIAPRVHNSSHYTMDACEGSQFLNHILAACRLPLKSTTADSNFAMVNLIGECTVDRSAGYQFHNLSTDERAYWYQKKEERPGRKMGHVNILNFLPTQLNRLREKKYL